MRHALRTVLATAVVVGVALTPVAVATSALAAPSASATAKPAATGDRYSGLTVSLAKGYIAVLRNHTADGGAEAWIRAVGPDWKPSDGHAGKVLEVLTVKHTSAKTGPLSLRLSAPTAEIPMLEVTDAAGTRTVLFPERVNDGGAKDHGGGGQGPTTPVGTDLGKRRLADGTYGELWKKADGWYVLELAARDGVQRGSVTAGGPKGQSENGRQVGGMWVGLNAGGKVGSWLNPAGGFDGEFDTVKGCTAVRTSGTPFGGLSLRLSNGSKGAVAEVLNADKGSVYDRLSTGDRYGVLGGAEVRDLSSGPVFRMRVHGGKSGWATLAFPKKPAGQGCAATTGTAKPAGTSGTSGTGTTTQTTATAATATGVQVVPKGAVAAGAEINGGGGHDTALLAGGAGLASVGAAGLGLVALRRRAGARA
ncbi:hypothetical protein [Streptomyces sp. cg36]|uniref:hypothetical protein n=1 Tax=Streptomyces sp. cg36 TaxID=3238798 RepID=UPI0034E21043